MAELEAERRALADAFVAVHATENALTAQQARLIVGIGDGLEQPDPLIESMSRARYGAGRATASRPR